MEIQPNMLTNGSALPHALPSTGDRGKAPPSTSSIGLRALGKRLIAQPRGAIAARFSLACAVAFPLLLGLAQAVHPELDPSWRPISEYALGAHGWIMTLAFVSWGFAALALALASRRDVRTRTAKVGLAFLVLGATGPLLAAVFPMDELSTPADQMSMGGMIHGLGAMLSDCFPIAAVLLTFALTRSRPHWAEHGRALWLGASAAGAALVASCVAMATQMPASGELGPEVSVGWTLRLFVVTCVGWIGVAAWVAARKDQRA